MYTSALVGVVGEYYDQIAVSSDNTTGNIRLGTYDESATKPANLLADTGSIPMTADYAYKSVTEFALTTVNVWLAFNKSAASNLERKSTTGTTYYKNTAYAALPNPFPAEDGSVTSVQRMKLGHS